MQPKEIGPCVQYVEKYYFNTQMGKCEKFFFGGCNPNENNFDTLSECQSLCSSLISMTKVDKVVKIDLGGFKKHKLFVISK